MDIKIRYWLCGVIAFAVVAVAAFVGGATLGATPCYWVNDNYVMVSVNGLSETLLLYAAFSILGCGAAGMVRAFQLD